MRVRLIFLINVILFLFILIISCDKNSVDPQKDDKIISQKVLFHFSYFNLAWGPQYHGWYIDNKATIWNLNENYHWWTEEMNILNKEDKVILYDSDSLNQCYEEGRDTVIAKINLDSLNYYYQLIDKASDGEYSEPECLGADIGSDIFGCLYYDEQNKKYRKVILSLWGDCQFTNFESNAIKINNWLRKINQNYVIQQ